MTAQTVDAKKAGKAARERIRKAIQKAKDDSRVIYTYTFDDRDGTYPLVRVESDGTVSETAQDAERRPSDKDAAAQLAKDATLAASGFSPEVEAEQKADEPEPKPEPELPEPLRETTVPETPESYAGDRAAFLKDHIEGLRSFGKVAKGSPALTAALAERDRVRDEAKAAKLAEKAAAKAERERVAAERKAARESGEPRSRGRLLVHPPSGIKIRMSESRQAECVERFGSLPVLDGVAFVRADGKEPGSPA